MGGCGFVAQPMGHGGVHCVQQMLEQLRMFIWLHAAFDDTGSHNATAHAPSRTHTTQAETANACVLHAIHTHTHVKMSVSFTHDCGPLATCDNK